MIATEKHYAFRGRLMSLLVLTHCGVSSRPLGLRLLVPTKTFAPTGQGRLLWKSSHAEKADFFFKESPCFSSASISC